MNALRMAVASHIFIFSSQVTAGHCLFGFQLKVEDTVPAYGRENMGFGTGKESMVFNIGWMI